MLVANARGEGSFTLSKAISSLSVISVLTSPLGNLLYAVPQVFAALGCFERIRTMLNSETWQDFRSSTSHGASDESLMRLDDKSDEGKRENKAQCVEMEAGNYIAVQNASFGWKQATPVVRNLSLKAGSGSDLTVILGPVGCGKSTLLQGILGEASLLDGSVWTRTKRMAFCGQSPWVSAGTVQQAIVGQSEFDMEWYQTVLHGCALDTDLEEYSDGDQTLIGDQGATLSGGQKQRMV